jgi:hypothetical protein
VRRFTVFRLICLIVPLLGYIRAEANETVAGDPFAVETAFTSMNTVAKPDGFHLSGFVESRNQLATGHFDRPISLRQKVQIEGVRRWRGLSAFISADASWDGAMNTWPGEHDPWRGGLREAYLTFDTNNFDVFVGRKVHRWGAGDGVNPMDIINPLDSKDPLASGRADNRLPVALASLTFSIGKMSFEGVFAPRAEVNDTPEYGSPWEPRSLHEIRASGAAGDEEKPNQWFGDAEFGGRFFATISGWDVALMVFRGFVDTPLFDIGASPGGLTFTAVHPRFSAYGLSFAKGFGNQTWRGEAAFKPDYPIQISTDPADYAPSVGEADLWQGVLGWDCDIDGKYYLNVQMFTDQQSRDDAAGKRRWSGLAYEISGLWRLDALKAGLRGKLYAAGDGALTELFFDYDVNDRWKTSVGLMIWRGEANGVLGEYDDNDFFYLTLRRVF